MPSITSSSPRRVSHSARWIVGLSCVNFAVLCALSYLLFGISEDWWVSTVLTYAPRLPYLVPSLALVLVSLFWHRASLPINLLSVGIVLAPVMGLAIPVQKLWAGQLKVDRTSSLTIVSCNVQEFNPDFGKVLEEIAVIRPDVVALQEALRADHRLDSFFQDWHIVHHGNFWIGSRYPVSLISTSEVKQFGGRLAGIVVEIETPTAKIVLGNVHQMTARHGLTELNRSTWINGDGTKELEAFELERHHESACVRSAIDTARGDRPMIVCGDFNTPVSSSLFLKNWGDFQSSFDVAGFGFGYTSPCKGDRFWPNNFPWARIDHILCSEEWMIHQCEVGKSDGSDHRLITATVQLKPEYASTGK